jgi:CRP/FNR family cyclic AMP-dependent transcriptional regulator
MSAVTPEQLARCEVFSGLTDAEIGSVAALAGEERHAGGEAVFEESSASTDLFVVLDGRVCVEIDAPAASGEGHEHLQLAVLREGEVFGEIAFLEGKRRSARVSAMDGVRVARLDGGRLQALFDTNPRLGYRVMSNLALVLAQRVVDVNFKWRQDRGSALPIHAVPNPRAASRGSRQR